MFGSVPQARQGDSSSSARSGTRLVAAQPSGVHTADFIARDEAGGEGGSGVVEETCTAGSLSICTFI